MKQLFNFYLGIFLFIGLPGNAAGSVNSERSLLSQPSQPAIYHTDSLSRNTSQDKMNAPSVISSVSGVAAFMILILAGATASTFILGVVAIIMGFVGESKARKVVKNNAKSAVSGPLASAEKSKSKFGMAQLGITLGAITIGIGLLARFLSSFGQY